MQDLDLLAALPPPRADEPAALRSDIVDELLDHLHCAFRREVLKDGDAAAAEKRVLARFGDPKQLARRLWWQAMWSRIMGKKILSGFQWLLTIAAVVMAGAVLWVQSQIFDRINDQWIAEANWRGNLQATLTDLRNRLPTPLTSTGTAHWSPEMGQSGASGGGGVPMLPSSDDMATAAGGGSSGIGPAADPFGSILPTQPQQPQQRQPSLTVRLVQDKEDGPPVTGTIQSIQLRTSTQVLPGMPEPLPPGGAGGGSAGVGLMAGAGAYGPQPTSSANGRFVFDGLQPDRYQLTIELADGQTGEQQILIRDETPRELIVICPSPRKKAPVLITVPPLPEDLQAEWRLNCTIESEPLQLGNTKWNLKFRDHMQVGFDPHSGEATVFQSSKSHLFFSAEEKDRAVFLYAGPVRVHFKLHVRGARSELDAQSAEPRIVQPGDNRWELEIPDDLLAQARKSFELPEWLPEPGPGERDSLPAPENAKPAEDLPSVPEPESAAEADDLPANRQIPKGDFCRLVLQLSVVGDEGPVPAEARIRLFDADGQPVRRFWTYRSGGFNGDYYRVTEDGECMFGLAQSGRFSVEVEFPDGRLLRQRLPLIRAGKEHTEKIACPPREIEKASIVIRAPVVPEDLRTAGFEMTTLCIPKGFQFEERTWFHQAPKRLSLRFEQLSGNLMERNDEDLSQDSLDDRLLILPIGEYYAAPTLERVVVKDGEEISSKVVVTPDRAINSRDDHFTAQIGDNQWELKVSEEFWAEARKRLANLESKVEPATNPPRDDDPPADAAAVQSP